MTTAKTTVPFMNIAAEFRKYEKSWLAKISEIGASGCFILGPEVSAFEREFAEHIGVKHAVAVANGTDALVLSLRALGIGPGDEVITTPYSFFASAEAISVVGARPVFADIDQHSFTIDPQCIVEKMTPKTKAILPVHIFGHACNMPAIIALAEMSGIAVIEDCAQAFGAKIDGRYVGAFGDCGCFSFYPTKVLGCFGDGGILTTNDYKIADHVRILRNHGMVAAYHHIELGCNSRLDEVQAALLRLRLRHADDDIEARRAVAAQYQYLLKDLALQTPQSPDAASHVYGVYTIRLKDRDRVRQALSARGICTALYYPQSLHLQTVYLDLGYLPGSMPISECLTDENLSLPIYPRMPLSQIKQVAEALSELL
jgi:dTDP-4-amino-4,6-dideoxygalactose transaminase